jgi:hypothetical protein
VSIDDVAEFRVGVTSAFEHDGVTDTSGAEVGPAVTTLVSWWNHLLCDRCGHSFRRGDRVLRDSRTWTVRHLDARLACAGAGDDDAPTAPAAELAEFAAGVDEAWPPAVDVPVTQLAADDWRVLRPPGLLTRARCLFCAHTFRAGEHIVVCPCRPADPACGAAVHRDPAAGLVCWESWRPAGTVMACPVTSAHRRPDGHR